MNCIYQIRKKFLRSVNQKNKLYGWANKNGKSLEFETLEETIENGRRLFRIGAIVDGELLAEAKAYNKKEASQDASLKAIKALNMVENCRFISLAIV